MNEHRPAIVIRSLEARDAPATRLSPERAAEQRAKLRAAGIPAGWGEDSVSVDAKIADLRASLAYSLAEHRRMAQEESILREQRDAQRARAEIAEQREAALRERIEAIVTDWGCGTVHAPRSPYYARLRAALADAAGAPRTDGGAR